MMWVTNHPRRRVYLGTLAGWWLAWVLLTPAVNADDSVAAYYEDRSRGWYWYEKDEAPSEEAPEPIASPQTSGAAPLTPRERLKKQGEEWEDALALAILEPSQENYLAYLERTAAIQQQAQAFAGGFKKTLWVTPELDYTIEKPRDTQAIIGMNDKRNQQHDRILQEVAKENGILFFFRSDCPHCHRFAPVLKLFAETYGFSVIAVSMDGKGLPEYPYPKPDHELASRLNISTVPAIFMVNPDSNAVATVGYGYNNWIKLKEKILFAAQQLTGTARKESMP